MGSLHDELGQWALFSFAVHIGGLLVWIYTCYKFLASVFSDTELKWSINWKAMLICLNFHLFFSVVLWLVLPPPHHPWLLVGLAAPAMLLHYTERYARPIFTTCWSVWFAPSAGALSTISNNADSADRITPQEQMVLRRKAVKAGETLYRVQRRDRARERQWGTILVGTLVLILWEPCMLFPHVVSLCTGFTAMVGLGWYGLSYTVGGALGMGNATGLRRIQYQAVVCVLVLVMTVFSFLLLKPWTAYVVDPTVTPTVTSLSLLPSSLVVDTAGPVLPVLVTPARLNMSSALFPFFVRELPVFAIPYPYSAWLRPQTAATIDDDSQLSAAAAVAAGQQREQGHVPLRMRQDDDYFD